MLKIRMKLVKSPRIKSKEFLIFCWGCPINKMRVTIPEIVAGTPKSRLLNDVRTDIAPIKRIRTIFALGFLVRANSVIRTNNKIGIRVRTGIIVICWAMLPSKSVFGCAFPKTSATGSKTAIAQELILRAFFVKSEIR